MEMLCGGGTFYDTQGFCLRLSSLFGQGCVQSRCAPLDEVANPFALIPNPPIPCPVLFVLTREGQFGRCKPSRISKLGLEDRDFAYVNAGGASIWIQGSEID